MRRLVGRRGLLGVLGCAAIVVATFIVAIDPLPGLVIPGTALFGATAAVCLYFYFRLYRDVHTVRLALERGLTQPIAPVPEQVKNIEKDPRPAITPIDRADLERRLANVSSNASGAALAFLAQLILNPRQHIERITDRAVQADGGFEVSTTYTVRVPSALDGVPIWFPIRFQSKGELADSLQFFDGHDQRLSSLPQVERIALILTLFRYLVLAPINSGPLRRGQLARYESSVGAALIEHLIERPAENSATTSRQRCVTALTTYGDQHPGIQAALALLDALDDGYPVIVAVDTRRGDTASAPAATTTTDSRLRLRMVRHALTIWTENAPAARGGPVGADGSGRAVPTDRRRPSARLRRVFGVEPSAIMFPLRNAIRAQSYHVQISGPDRSFLAYQALMGPASGPGLDGVRVQTRHGQRDAHLRTRGGEGARDLYYVVSFDERPPGTMAWATVASSMATFLIIMSVLLSGRPNVDPSGLIAVLLSAPALVGAWRALSTPEQISGRSLAPRISLLMTVVASLSASIVSLVPWSDQGSLLAFPTTPPERFAWAACLALTVTTTVTTAGAWLIRESAEARLASRAFVDDAALWDRIQNLPPPGFGQWVLDTPGAASPAAPGAAVIQLLDEDHLAESWRACEESVRIQASSLSARAQPRAGVEPPPATIQNSGPARGPAGWLRWFRRRR